MNPSIHRSGLSVATFLMTLALTALPGSAARSQDYKIVEGLAVYLGVLPAAMTRGHRETHPESTMHGGTPSGRHVYHVMVAIFEDASGKRIGDAEVKAQVSGVGLIGSWKTLEPMQIAGTVTYGNYFALPGRDVYRIRVEMHRPGAPEPLRADFVYEHRLR